MYMPYMCTCVCVCACIYVCTYYNKEKEAMNLNERVRWEYMVGRKGRGENNVIIQ